MRVKDLSELLSMWKEDCKIDDMNFDDESLRSPVLHSKYIDIMSEHNLYLKRLEKDFRQLKRIMWQYYRGELNNPEDLKKHGLPPMQYKILKAEVVTWLESDNELAEFQLKIDHQKEIVDTCKSIISAISNRRWDIRNAIEWRKFINGE